MIAYTSIQLGEAQKKMSGFLMMMYYRLTTLSVTADPMALLTVQIDGGNDGKFNIEDLAEVAIPQEDQFAIVPKNPAYIFPITKAITLEHPEYKIEVKSEMDGENIDSESDMKDDEDEELSMDKIIYCYMPVVNEDKRNAGMDYIKILYDETMTKLDATKTIFEGKFAKKLIDHPKELDEARKELDKMYEQHKTGCEEYRKDKEEALEKAYQKYLTEKEEKEKKEQEEKAAKGENAGKSMKMDPFASFE